MVSAARQDSPIRKVPLSTSWYMFPVFPPKAKFTRHPNPSESRARFEVGRSVRKTPENCEIYVEPGASCARVGADIPADQAILAGLGRMVNEFLTLVVPTWPKDGLDVLPETGVARSNHCWIGLMRITGPKRNTQVTAKSKAGKSDAAQGGFNVAEGTKAPAAKGAQAARPLAAMDALISIQEVPDATARRAKAIARAEDMLDILEELKIAILTGTLPKSRVTRLARIVEDARGEVSGDELSTVLDEIELRARVELAKLENAA